MKSRKGGIVAIEVRADLTLDWSAEAAEARHKLLAVVVSWLPWVVASHKQELPSLVDCLWAESSLSQAVLELR